MIFTSGDYTIRWTANDVKHSPGRCHICDFDLLRINAQMDGLAIAHLSKDGYRTYVLWEKLGSSVPLVHFKISCVCLIRCDLHATIIRRFCCQRLDIKYNSHGVKYVFLFVLVMPAKHMYIRYCGNYITSIVKQYVQ